MKESQKVRQKSATENRRDLDQLREKLINFNFEKETGTLKKVHQIGKAKKQIARLITIIQQQNQEDVSRDKEVSPKV